MNSVADISLSGLSGFDAARTQQLDTQRRFAQVLSIEQRRAGGNALPADEARESAEQLVSIAFVQPLLAQLREATWAAPPFQPTQAEKQFRSLGDAAMARDIVGASNFPLVDKIAETLADRTNSLRASNEKEQA